MKVVKHGSHVATEDRPFACHQCNCEFVVEPGDFWWSTDIHNKAGARFGKDQSEQFTFMEHTKCPECGVITGQLRATPPKAPGDE